MGFKYKSSNYKDRIRSRGYEKMGKRGKTELESMKPWEQRGWADLVTMEVMIMKPWARRGKTELGAMELMTAKCIHNGISILMIIPLKLKVVEALEVVAKMMITYKAERVVTNCAAAKAMMNYKAKGS